MVMKIANAAAAYANTATQGINPGMAARDTAGPSFSSLVEEAARGSIDSARGGEKATAEAVTGRADLTDVVTAVSNAEVAVQTVVAVRDRVVAAYQEILRMPI